MQKRMVADLIILRTKTCQAIIIGFLIQNKFGFNTP